MRVLNFFNAIYNRCVNAGAWVSGALLIVLVVIINFSVFMRYVVERPQGYVDELCDYMLLFATFLAVAWVLKVRGHVSMNLIPSILKRGTRAKLEAATSIIGAVIFALITYYGAIDAIEAIQQNLFFPGSVLDPRPPKGYIIAVLPLGCFLLTIQCVIDAYRCITTGQPLPTKEAKH